MHQKKSKITNTLLFVPALIGFVWALALTQSYLTENQKLVEEKRSAVEKKAKKSSEQINIKLEAIRQKVDNLAADLSKEELPGREGLLEKLRQVMYSSPAFIEAGIALKPFKYPKDQNMRLFGVAYTAGRDGLEPIQLDEREDYTNPEAGWYHLPLKYGAGWLEPDFDRSHQQMAATYAAVLKQSGEKIGVIYLKMTIDSFSRELNKLDLGDRGYAFLFSATRPGKYILHPDVSFLNNSVRDYLRKPPKIKGRKDADQTKIFSSPGRVRFSDPETRLDSIAITKDIPGVSWRLGLSFVVDDFVMEPASARRKIIHIAFLMGASVLMLLVPLLKMDAPNDRGLWRLSFAYSAGCFFLLVTILCSTLIFPEPENYDRTRITHQYALSSFKNEHIKKSLAHSENLPVFIPTGVYIQSLTFINATNVRLTGYVWQRYTKSVHNDIARGFVMPESEEVEIKEAYRHWMGDSELIGWKFRVVLHQKFDYSRYPFARENVWIQLWHKEFYRNVILVPDMGAYQQTNPSCLPGLLQGLDIPGWKPESTFFSYRKQSYKTDFGLQDYSGLTDFPELFFNIHIVKAITGSLVTHIIPISVIIIMLFAIFLLTNKEERKGWLLGFNTLNVIASCAGFFLVVVFSHIDLREGLSTKGIVYIEYYYFITYIFILAVALNSLIYSLTENRLVHFKDNKLVQMLYWPVNQTAILSLTLLNFY